MYSIANIHPTEQYSIVFHNNVRMLYLYEIQPEIARNLLAFSIPPVLTCIYSPIEGDPVWILQYFDAMKTTELNCDRREHMRSISINVKYTHFISFTELN